MLIDYRFLKVDPIKVRIFLEIIPEKIGTGIKGLSGISSKLSWKNVKYDKKYYL